MLDKQKQLESAPLPPAIDPQNEAVTPPSDPLKDSKFGQLASRINKQVSSQLEASGGLHKDPKSVAENHTFIEQPKAPKKTIAENDPLVEQLAAELAGAFAVEGAPPPKSIRP